MDNKLICCLCGRICEDRYGNNPAPLMEDNGTNRCCNVCNDAKVIPARIANIEAGKSARELSIDKNNKR